MDYIDFSKPCRAFSSMKSEKNCVMANPFVRNNL
jgi:hypothetical protein